MTFEIKSGIVALEVISSRNIAGLETDAWRQQGDELSLSGRSPDVLMPSQCSVSRWCSVLSHSTGCDIIDQAAANFLMFLKLTFVLV